MDDDDSEVQCNEKLLPVGKAEPDLELLLKSYLLGLSYMEGNLKGVEDMVPAVEKL